MKRSVNPQLEPSSDSAKTAWMSRSVQPIGVVHSSAKLKHHLPYQPMEQGLFAEPLSLIELLPGHNFEQALEGIDDFDYIWILFWMDQATHWKVKVQPPGLGRRVGVFATRSPHRPNPIGLSCVRLIKREGRILTIEGSDMLDQTPVLDIKPYLLSADAKSAGRQGWVEERELWTLLWQTEFLEALELLSADPYLRKEYIERALKWGPVANSSNRLRIIENFSTNGRGELALGEWRVLFSWQERCLKPEKISSGYSLESLNESHPYYELHVSHLFS